MLHLLVVENTFFTIGPFWLPGDVIKMVSAVKNVISATEKCYIHHWKCNIGQKCDPLQMHHVRR